MWQFILNHYSDQSRASRRRAKERTSLCDELLSLKSMRIYGYCREATILGRLRVLDKVDAAALAQSAGERRKPGFRLVAPAPDYVIQDEVLRELRMVPR